MADPDLQIKGVGGRAGHPEPALKYGAGGGEGLGKFFSALRASVWSKNKEWVRVPRAPLLDPPLFCTGSLRVNLF